MPNAPDGLPEARAQLLPDQQAIRNACVEFFDGDVYSMANELGYRPQSIYGWIEGTRVPGRRVFDKLIHVLRLKSFADLWVPDAASVYFHGRRVSARVERRIAKVLRTGDPDLAERLRL